MQNFETMCARGYAVAFNYWTVHNVGVLLRSCIVLDAVYIEDLEAVIHEYLKRRV